MLMQMARTQPVTRLVRVWLWVGVVMIFMQVVIGGITRLTGSGLSITKWDIVTGTLPPLSAAAWESEFELYQATPQYHKINKGMSLGDFKFIFFWEYLHRLWARSLGFVFLLPFLWFWRRGLLPPWLMRRLGVTVLLGAIVATFGWIMVASGLINRPWVNAYKLTLHLSLALLVFSHLIWTVFKTYVFTESVIHNQLLKSVALWVLIVGAIQIMLGGVMSGMKAGLFYPTWPDMNGSVVPPTLLDSNNWTLLNMEHYDKHLFASGLVQFLHRSTAYLLIIMVLCYAWLCRKVHFHRALNYANALLYVSISLQVLLGILTVINCIGTVPVGLGVLHQAGALLLLSSLLFVNYQMRIAKTV